MKTKKWIMVLGIVVLAATVVLLALLLMKGTTISVETEQITKEEIVAQNILEAIKENDTEGLNKLLSDNKKLDINNYLLFKGVLPLEQCAFYGRLDMFKMFINNGADINASKTQEIAPDIILCACKGGNIDLVKYIASLGKDIRVSDPTGGNAALYTAESGNVALFEYVVDQGVPTDVTTSFGYDVVMMAASADDLSLLDYLEGKGYSLDNKADTNKNFLYFATSEKNFLYLIDKYPDKISGATTDKQNLLFHAVECNYTNAVKTLITVGKFDLNAQNEDGDTALMDGINGGCNIEIVRLLVDGGTKLTIKNATDETAYDIAVRLQEPSVADLVKTN